MSTFLRGRKLVLEVDAGRTRLDHRLHQFESIQGAAESCFGISHDGSYPVDAVLPIEMMDLVGTQEGVVDPSSHVGDAVGRVQALIWIHLARVIRVGCDLPSTQIDGLQTGPHLLDCLIAGQRTERRYIRFTIEQLPESFGAKARERILDLDRPT